MKNFIVAALGLLLFVSAAAASAHGNGNTVTVSVNTAATGMSIAGAGVVQMNEIDANLLGDDIVANQIAGLNIEGGIIEGQGDGKTNAVQAADLMLNDTGSANVNLQSAYLSQVENDLEVGNITQMATLEIDDFGDENSINQLSSASAGGFHSFVEPNTLANSELEQVSLLSATATGSANDIAQSNDQFATYIIMTSSELYQQAAINADILGDGNIGTQGIFQDAGSNLLDGSWADQVACIDEQTTGNYNDVSQLARPYLINNILTNSTAYQSINVINRVQGSDNAAVQSVDTISDGNTVADGHIVQTSKIETNI